MDVKEEIGSVIVNVKESVVLNAEARLNESEFAEAEILEGAFVLEIILTYLVLNP